MHRLGRGLAPTAPQYPAQKGTKMESHRNLFHSHSNFLRGYAFAQSNGGAGGAAGGGGVGPQDLEQTGPAEEDLGSPGNIKTGGTEGSGIPGEPPPSDRVPGAPPQNAVE